MKRFAVIVMTGALVLALVPDAGAGKGKKQKVEGSIALPAPHPDGCYSGLHRRLMIVTQDQGPNGVIGYDFDIDKKTWSKPFVLKVTGGQGTVDLDITFYTEFGTVEQAADTQYAPGNIAYDTREAGGEAGTVPPQMKRAIVCLYAGSAGYGGMNAGFTYVAGKGVKAPS